MRFEQCTSGICRLWLSDQDLETLSRSFGNEVFAYVGSDIGFLSVGTDAYDIDMADFSEGGLGITLTDADREFFPRIITREFIQPVGCLDAFGGSIFVDVDRRAE